jgi:hypothetical protein
MLGEAVHTEPAWREQADFIVGARFEIDSVEASEQLFARRVGALTFEICCIPFFVYDLALGDIVLTDEQYTVVRVIEPSGRYVFRARIEADAANKTAMWDQLVALGALVEKSSERFWAIDAKDDAFAQAVADQLQRWESSGSLTYETGRL